MTTEPTELLDCLIVGGGPAGLTAGLYLARFRRSLAVIDADESRAMRIPRSHNAPGLPGGIDGPMLVARHREQAAEYGVQPVAGTVTQLSRECGGGFAATVDAAGTQRQLFARTVLISTGSKDVEPSLPNVEDAIRQGLVRHCPVCDGYEVVDQNVAVLGVGKSGLGEALYMRTFSDRVTLLTLGQTIDLDPQEQDVLRQAGIRVIEEPIAELTVADKKIGAIRMASGQEHRFDTLYSALGGQARNALTLMIGAEHDAACHAVIVDQHQKTTVPDVWAAGDVASSLNQISVAWGQAAIAATDIHNVLRRRDAECGIYGPSSPAGAEAVLRQQGL